MNDRSLVLALAAIVVSFVLGFAVADLFVTNTRTVDSSTVPTLATVTLAPDGQPYCPSDPQVPHPVPCLTP